jgi:GalNAc-alpha-(1->4)-GalNAc-alpha-(1->3)-diNAcBac-PP-undecaprenol alpha-1,4-N-acetyl-D-galactosaminyltransferase
MTSQPKHGKYLFVIDSLSTGGAQRQLINLAIGLKKRGYNIDFFCYAPGDLLAKPLVDAGIEIHRKIKSSRYSPDVLIALKDLLNRNQYNLVLSFLTTPNFYTILAGRLLSHHRLPVIVSERRCDLPQGASLIVRFSRQFYRLATYVVTNSHHQRTDLANKYPWMRNKLSTIYNGCDLSYFVPALGQPLNQPIKILTVAHVSPHKNGLCLVEALNLLHHQDHVVPQVDWIGQLVLKGAQFEYLNEMNKRIERYGLSNQWNWLEQRTDIVDQMHQHDVLVHPSFGEGLPNVVCEALACAKPVILSDTLDHSRLIQHGESGYLFNYQDPADLAEKINHFICLTSDEREKMGQCGRQFALANLAMERLVDEYEKLFLELLA